MNVNFVLRCIKCVDMMLFFHQEMRLMWDFPGLARSVICVFWRFLKSSRETSQQNVEDRLKQSN